MRAGTPYLRRIRSPLLAITIACATPVAAQVRYNTADTRVEILGLERWTRRMLEDSIAHYAPGQTLASAACMATLRGPLKFRDALVSQYPPGMGRPNAPAFLAIRVAEPGRPAAWRTLTSTAYPSLLPTYAPLIVSATDAKGAIWPGRLLNGFQYPDSLARQYVLPRLDSASRVDYERAATFVDAHRGAPDRELALRVLDSSSAYGNRMAAAMVLTNFPEDDQTWYALIRALRDPHEAVRWTAETALQRMPRRTINWAPVTTELRALVGGSNLTALDGVLRLLVETQVSPALGRAVLRGNDVWVMRLLTAEAPGAAARAKALLVAFNNGTDLGSKPDPWRKWIATR